MAKNAMSNLDAGSKASPIVGECRDVAEGVATGDFKQVAANTALLGLCALGGAGAGSQKTAGLVSSSMSSQAASSAAAALALGTAHSAAQGEQKLSMAAGGSSGAGGSHLHPVAGRFKEELIATAKAIGHPGRGILAADESTGTIGKRLANISVENTHANRLAYRELLFTAPSLEQHISGVIMYDETARDSTADGRRFVKVLRDRGIHCGIKVDCGLDPLAGGAEGETFTKGLAGLAARCAEYYEMGCRFAKWRAVLKIGDGQPTDAAIRANARGLAAYGAICQAHGLVPIIEPEILQDGDHSIEVCAEASERVLTAVMAALQESDLLIEGLMLKPNMVTPGATCPKRASPEEVAWLTVRTLSRTIVPALPVVCFLSGGQSEEDASLNLNAMNKLDVPRPWALTFSYGRALQSSVLQAWGGKVGNVAAAQATLLTRAEANGSAALGKYAGGTGSRASDFVADYKY